MARIIICFLLFVVLSANGARWPPLPIIFEDEAVPEMDRRFRESMHKLEVKLNTEFPTDNLQDLKIPPFTIKEQDSDLNVEYKKANLSVSRYEIYTNVTTKTNRILHMITDLVMKNVTFSGIVAVEGSTKGTNVNETRKFETLYNELTGRVSVDVVSNRMMVMTENVNVLTGDIHPTSAQIEGADIEGIFNDLILNKVDKPVEILMKEFMKGVKQNSILQLDHAMKDTLIAKEGSKA